MSSSTMPLGHCNRNRHRLRERGYGRFHPYLRMMGPHHHAAAAAAFFFDQKDGEEASSFLKGKARISEELSSGNTDDGGKNHYVVEMAIPGVQPNHITIEEKQGELEIVAVRLDSNEEVVKTYQDVLFLHPSKADFASLVATTKNGILTIRIPKKFQEQVLTIETESAPPPPRRSTQKNKKTAEAEEDGGDDTVMEQDVQEQTQEDFYVSWDLPGFSPSDLVVEVHNDRDENQLQVTAQMKKRGDDNGDDDDDEGNMITMSVRRFMTVPPSIDMTQAHAYLQHGVFTLMAPPARHQQGDENGNGLVRTFYATPEEDAVLPEVATLQINEKEEETTATTMVETVSHEWETIDGNELSDKNAEQNNTDVDGDQKPEAK